MRLLKHQSPGVSGGGGGGVTPVTPALKFNVITDSQYISLVFRKF